MIHCFIRPWIVLILVITVAGSEESAGPVEDRVCCAHSIERRDSEDTDSYSKSLVDDGTPSLHRSKRQMPQMPHSESAVQTVLTVTSLALMLGCLAAITIAVIIGIYICRLYERAVEASLIPYWKTVESGDKFTFGTSPRKLAYSAQMYHYEQQKRRIIEEEKATSQASKTDVASDEESNGNSYVVYEYPGLASTEELEVRNPFYDEDLLLALSNLKNREKDEERFDTDEEKKTPNLKNIANNEETIEKKDEEKTPPSLKNRAKDEGNIDTKDTQEITSH